MNKLPHVLTLYFAHLLLLAAGLITSTESAAEKQWWPTKVNVFNPACTDGDINCWTDPRNDASKLELLDYTPLMPNDVRKKHHICVSFPHLKDSYWKGVAYGVISEGRRLKQKITLVEAGGYTNLEWQLNQVEDCIANGAEALVIGPISSHGNARQIDMIRAQGIPVVVIITGINTMVDASSLQSFYNMGHASCEWIVDQHADNKNIIRVVWFPGPPGAGWSTAADQGCRSAVKNTNVKIVDTKWGDTGKGIQLKLVEEVLQTMTSGKETELDYIVGTATTIEGAVGAIRFRELEEKIKLVAFYYTPGMQIFLKRGAVAMAPSDQMITQAQIAIDQALRMLENKPMATGGRPEYNNTGRLVEHVQPPVVIVTPETVHDFDTSTTLAPKNWTPKFSVD
ncbi:periplasmic binding protein/LacI transcriptional regulator [gamma proteobacterium IMCC2047]|nr:periplasmic binding protein/LacI transcriptional regulator [gamma proteobacterium IMCC2047]